MAGEVGHRLSELRARHRRGRPSVLLLWLDAGNGSFDLHDLARAIALATGDQSLTAAPADQKAQALRAYLADRPAVLVIDNLRLTASGAQQLIDFLKSLPTGSIAVVSANTPRRLSGARFWLEELEEQATQELLVTEGRRHGVPEVENADPQTVARIHRLVGGNPRAIGLFVLAAARLRGRWKQHRAVEGGDSPATGGRRGWSTANGTTRVLRLCDRLCWQMSLKRSSPASGAGSRPPLSTASDETGRMPQVRQPRSVLRLYPPLTAAAADLHDAADRLTAVLAHHRATP